VGAHWMSADQTQKKTFTNMRWFALWSAMGSFCASVALIIVIGVHRSTNEVVEPASMLFVIHTLCITFTVLPCFVSLIQILLFASTKYAVLDVRASASRPHFRAVSYALAVVNFESVHLLPRLDPHRARIPATWVTAMFILPLVVGELPQSCVVAYYLVNQHAGVFGDDAPFFVGGFSLACACLSLSSRLVVRCSEAACNVQAEAMVSTRAVTVVCDPPAGSSTQSIPLRRNNSWGFGRVAVRKNSFKRPMMHSATRASVEIHDILPVYKVDTQDSATAAPDAIAEIVNELDASNERHGNSSVSDAQLAMPEVSPKPQTSSLVTGEGSPKYGAAQATQMSFPRKSLGAHVERALANFEMQMDDGRPS
jgi:hypothetical protein